MRISINPIYIQLVVPVLKKRTKFIMKKNVTEERVGSNQKSLKSKFHKFIF